MTTGDAQEAARRLAEHIADVLSAEFAVMHVEGDTYIESGVEKPNPLAGEPMEIHANWQEIAAAIAPVLASFRQATLAQAAKLACVHCAQGISFPAKKYRLHLPNPRYGGHRSWCRAWRIRALMVEPSEKETGR